MVTTTPLHPPWMPVTWYEVFLCLCFSLPLIAHPSYPLLSRNCTCWWAVQEDQSGDQPQWELHWSELSWHYPAVTGNTKPCQLALTGVRKMDNSRCKLVQADIGWQHLTGVVMSAFQGSYASPHQPKSVYNKRICIYILLHIVICPLNHPDDQWSSC